VLGWDRRLEGWQAAHRSGVLDPVFEGLSYAGEYGALWLALGLVLALALRRWQIFVLTLVADALAQVSSTVLKDLIPRARPHGHTLVARPHTHSFPSGHATASFACATVVALAVPRFRWPLIVLAAAVSWSRVYVGVHYPLDVVGGAALGAAIGFGVVSIASTLRSR
jgi:undecaprenyl-diphosphatase